METLDLKKIVPDENQPRKYFAEDKMRSLRESIKKIGIKNPLVVEDMGSGKFLLIDGERRFRAAVELELDKVPVIVEKPKSMIDRLVEQFSIQEHHEEWSPVEKAQALIKISEEMGLSLRQAMTLLNISNNVQTRYAAFAALADKEGFLRSATPIEYATPIRSVVNNVISLTEKELEEKLSRQDEKKIERRIVDLIKIGDIRKRGDVIRLKDSFVKNPKLIRKFIDTAITSGELYKESKAKGAYHLRNLVNSAQYVISHSNAFLKIRDIKLTPAQSVILKNCARVVTEVADLGM